ncbi:MAG: ISKra4 family transposase [Acidimicrobiales bacterium]
MPRTLDTPCGTVTVERAYYHCPDCGGYVPWDCDLGLESSRQSPGLQPLVALAGALAPFGKSEDVLRRLAGVRLSDSTCRRRTEEAGLDLREQHQAGTGVRPPAGQRPWDLTLPDRDEQSFAGTVAYVGLDAFAVPTRGPGGRGIAYRMLYTGLLYDPRKKHTVYVADFDHEAAAAQLRLYATALGLGRADTLVALTDAGNGLEPALRRCCNGALAFVLDFYHAAEHVHAFAQSWHGRDSPAAQAWAAEAKGLLRERGGAGLLEHLQKALPGPEAPAELHEAWRLLNGYVRDNAHRMDYPAYRARGWDIGSGPTEAGCKLLGGRLKGTGMRWCVCGSEQVAALRALYASGEGLWDAYWKERRLRNYQRN